MMATHGISLGIVLFSGAALAVPAAPARIAMDSHEPTEEQTCGQEIAAAAEVPLRWQELMNHVAANMEWHASWVAGDSRAAKAEHDELRKVAREYRAMARAAGRAAAAMTTMRDLRPAPHDESKLDRTAQIRWMRAKIKMQRELATLLTRHVEASETALADMEARPLKR